MTNKDPYDRSEDGTLTTEPPPIDVDALKREVIKANQDVNFTLFSDHIKWAIDYIASAGYLRAPLPRIDGLKESIEWEEKFLPVRRDALMKAGRAYLKASGVYGE